MILDPDGAQKGFVAWLLGPAGGFVTRILICLTTIIGTLAGTIIGIGVNSLHSDIAGLSAAILSLTERVGGLTVDVAVERSRGEQRERVVDAHGAQLLNHESRITRIEAGRGVP
jgi:hypothetical protein